MLTVLSPNDDVKKRVAFAYCLSLADGDRQRCSLDAGFLKSGSF